MIIKTLWQPTTDDAYGNSLGTTRTKDGVLSTDNLSWARNWAKVRGLCKQLQLEADAHIYRWIRDHSVSVHAWDLTGSSGIPVLLFGDITQFTVFFDVKDIDKTDRSDIANEPDGALLKDHYKALHCIACMPRLTKLTVRWRADTKHCIKDWKLRDLQSGLFEDIFEVLYCCSPTGMESLKSVTFVGFDADIENRDELCKIVWREAEEQLRAVKVSFVGSAIMEYVV